METISSLILSLFLGSSYFTLGLRLPEPYESKEEKKNIYGHLLKNEQSS